MKSWRDWCLIPAWFYWPFNPRNKAKSGSNHYLFRFCWRICSERFKWISLHLFCSLFPAASRLKAHMKVFLHHQLQETFTKWLVLDSLAAEFTELVSRYFRRNVQSQNQKENRMNLVDCSEGRVAFILFVNVSFWTGSYLFLTLQMMKWIICILLSLTKTVEGLAEVLKRLAVVLNVRNTVTMQRTLSLVH